MNVYSYYNYDNFDTYFVKEGQLFYFSDRKSSEEIIIMPGKCQEGDIKFLWLKGSMI